MMAEEIIPLIADAEVIRDKYLIDFAQPIIQVDADKKKLIEF